MARRWLGAICLAISLPAAAARGIVPAYVAVLIDDLGNSLPEGRRVIDLPGPVACAILPYAPYGRELAEEAYRRHKEVVLHLPMQPDDPAQAQAMGPGHLDRGMPERELVFTFEYDLAGVPHAAGVNNHMGSYLTRRWAPMRELMRAIAAHRGLFFIDSRTAPGSVAARAAAEQGVPTLTRDVFLDNDLAPRAIAGQLTRLATLARAHGAALAIGHPHPQTLEALERWIPAAAARGVELVSISSLLRIRARGRTAGDRGSLLADHYLKSKRVPKKKRERSGTYQAGLRFPSSP